ncbi:hypothetical protein NDU88_005113 [Pleurodeles waltl]|uniref:Uncharacterized protein n=1 Tax=Pleurodeles waltl TaxID=8319 RepID=A0AAV7UHV6_PLEWA|nr:hypothetical protein NDU88_005113 [Pleurodeles waltl]
MSFSGNTVAQSEHAKDAFSGPGEGRGCVPVTALKRSHLGEVEWHTRIITPPQQQPEDEDRLLHDVGQEEASGVEVPSEYDPNELESTWLDLDEESVEEGEIRDEDEGRGKE